MNLLSLSNRAWRSIHSGKATGLTVDGEVMEIVYEEGNTRGSWNFDHENFEKNYM